MFIEPEHFCISRSKWSRGRGKNTCLLDEMGDKDCLGFFFKACGATDAQLFRLDEPVDVVQKFGWQSKLMEYAGLVVCQTNTCRSIIATNDAPCMEEARREALLVKLFSLIDIRLYFAD